VDSGHIAIVISGLGAGGAERVASMLSRHWTGQGRRVTVIAFDSSDTPVFHPFPDDAEIIRLGDHGAGGTGIGVLGRLVGLRRALRRLRPDAVVSFLTKNNLLALLATFGTPARTVCCERNNPERQAKHPLWNRLLERLYPRADAIICQTRDVVRCMPEAARHLVRVIPNPVEIGPRAGPSAEGKRLVAVGRLTEQKGFDVLLRAFGAIAADFPGWQLDIWGEGGEKAALEGLIAAKGLEGRARLRGVTPFPRGWIEGADLFALPSRYEGFPNVLAEAMAAGIPTVASNCDFGPSDMIENGTSGSLVPPNDENALAAELARLMGEPALRQKYAQEGREAMRRFAPERVLAQWDEVLDAVLGSAGARGGQVEEMPEAMAGGLR
jgi:glycosyltransferase involved in cell wall biosynthesis